MILKETERATSQNPPQPQGSRMVRRMAQQIWFEARVALTWVHLAIPAGFALILWGLLSGPPIFRSVRSALVNVELLLPMLAGLFVSDTMTREWAEGTADWRPAQPGGPVRLLAIRLFNTFVLWIAVAAVFLVGVHVLYLRPVELTLPLKDTIVLIGPPALFFTGLAVLASLIARTSLGGLIGAAGYWAFAWMTGGSYTGPFHVLYLRAPLEQWSLEATRWWLLAGGVVLLAIGGVFAAKGERWVR